MAAAPDETNLSASPLSVHIFGRKDGLSDALWLMRQIVIIGKVRMLGHDLSKTKEDQERFGINTPEGEAYIQTCHSLEKGQPHT